MARKTIAQLERENAELKRQVTEKTAVFDRFKTQVRNVADRTRVEQNWCTEGFNDAMDELGLKPLQTTGTAKITVELTFDVNDEDTDPFEDEEEVRQAVRDAVDQLEYYDCGLVLSVSRIINLMGTTVTLDLDD